MILVTRPELEDFLKWEKGKRSLPAWNCCVHDALQREGREQAGCLPETRREADSYLGGC